MQPNSNKGEYSTMSYNSLQQELYLACINGHIDLVRYLLEAPNFNCKPCVSLPLVEDVCDKNQYDIFEVFLTSGNLEQSALSDTFKRMALHSCISKGHIDNLRHFLVMPQLFEGRGGKKIMSYVVEKSLELKRYDVLEFLICEKGIKKNRLVNLYLEVYRADERQQVVHMFEMAQLHARLDDSLPLQGQQVRKAKI